MLDRRLQQWRLGGLPRDTPGHGCAASSALPTHTSVPCHSCAAESAAAASKPVTVSCWPHCCMLSWKPPGKEGAD